MSATSTDVTGADVSHRISHATSTGATTLSSVMDPQTVEEQSQAEIESYKVYKRRWLVLFAMFSVTLVVGLHRSMISIADILINYMKISIYNYDQMTQVSMYMMLITVLIMARALDYFGLRRMAYVACTTIICANILKALCCADPKYVPNWVEPNRFLILLLSEVFVGLAQAIAFCVPAKVASAWFAHYENTLALVIANCGYNMGVGFSNYFTPIFIRSGDDMFKLSYMFLTSGAIVTFIVLACVTRSSPKMPPSSSAIMSASTSVPLATGVAIMFRNSSYVLLLVTVSLNLATLGGEQLILEDILKSQSYSNNFCGTLIAHSYFLGTFFMLMGATWIDNSVNYIKVSRISSMICALTLATFNISITLPGIKNVIIVTNIMAAFGCSLMMPALLQVSFRTAATILPEATVSALVTLLQQFLSIVLMSSLSPLQHLSGPHDGYQAPLTIFSCAVILVNIMYASSFKPPDREELQRQLRARGNHELLENE